MGRLTTDELIFRIRSVASAKGADCPHLLLEAARRLGSFDTDLKGCKRTISAFERWNKKGFFICKRKTAQKEREDDR